MRRPSFRALARIAGYAAVAAAAVAAGLALRFNANVPVPASTQPAGVDPLAAELARCRAISVSGQAGPGCAAAWAENRRRFFVSPAAAPEKE
jgi:conjugative transfer region protein TrbK